MIGKRVAIIGAGSSGLTSAKYALENGLFPTIFEKSNDICGLWSNESSNKAVWDGLYSNISFYTEQFSDFPWPKNSLIFPGAKDIYKYLRNYADNFSLKNFIRLNNKIELVSQQDDNKWKINSIDLVNKNKKTELFDFVMVASGLHSQARIPFIENSNKFKGIQMHSSQFKLNDLRLKSKSVAVIGCGLSGAEIAANLVNHSEKVFSIFKRPYLMSPRLIKFKDNDKYKILPIDLYFNKRCSTYPPKNSNEFDRKKFLSTMFPEQTNKILSHPALYFDLDDPNQETLISITDNYMSYVRQNKIKPIRSEIKQFESANSVRLEDDSIIDQLDAIIYCTGYTSGYFDFFDENTLKKLNYVPNVHYKHPIVLYKNTFHPSVKNLALIGQQEGLYFNGAELQAKWASNVFSGKINLPPCEKMNQFIDKEIKKRNQNRQSQYPCGPHVLLSDNIANEMNLLPDFEKLRVESPKLFDMFWNNSMISTHFIFKINPNSALDSMNEIDKMNGLTHDCLNEEASNQEIAFQFSKHYRLPTQMLKL